MSLLSRMSRRASLMSVVACALAGYTGTTYATDQSITLGFRAINPNRAGGFFLRPSTGSESGKARVEYNIDNSCEYYVQYDEYFFSYTDTGAKVEAWDSNGNEPHFDRGADGEMFTLGITGAGEVRFFYRYATMPSVELQVLRDSEGQEVGQTIKRTGDLTYHALGIGSTVQSEKTGLGAYLSGAVGIGLANFEGEWSSVIVPLTVEAGGQYYLPFSDSWLMARFGYYAGGALMIGDSPCYLYGGPSFALYYRF